MRASIAIGLILVSTGLGAQTRREPPPDRLLRDPYVTSTGATVDRPGQPQGSAPTALDRNIRKKDNAIDASLCKGC